MILTRSPYYYRVALDQYSTSVVFAMSIRYSTTTSTQKLAKYTVNKQVPSNKPTHTWIDISQFVKDLFVHGPIDLSQYSIPTVIPSREMALLSMTASVKNSLNSVPSSVQDTFRCVDGQGYYIEGQNFEPSKRILLSHNEYRADENGYFIVPLRVIDGTEPVILDGNSISVNYTANDFNYIKYLIIPLGPRAALNVEVEYAGETIFIERVDECKYDAKVVQFINRFGAMELMHFMKSKRDTLSIESSTFKNAYTDGLQYAIQRHQYKQYNKMSRRKTKIESGYLNEAYNATVQELLESEHVWIDGRPINVDTSSLEIKTKEVEKLISYSIDFEYAFDEINNV